MSAEKSVKFLSSEPVRNVRRGLPWVFAIAAATALVSGYVRDPQLLLDYLRVLAWPVIVAVLLCWLRIPIRAKVTQLLRVDFGGATAQFALNQELERDLQGPAEVLATTLTEDSGKTDQEDQHATSAKSGEMEVHRPGGSNGLGPVMSQNPGLSRSRESSKDERARRRAIVRIIEESAGWGFDMARLGAKTRPVPIVHWSDDGRPRVEYEGSPKTVDPRSPDPASIIGYDPRIKVRNLEEEIRRLERSLNTPRSPLALNMNPLGGDPRAADKERLLVLKARLARLDPNSALVD